jgi:hypothetical protein
MSSPGQRQRCNNSCPSELQQSSVFAANSRVEIQAEANPDQNPDQKKSSLQASTKRRSALHSFAIYIARAERGGAGEENRTPVSSLGSYSSAIELHPPVDGCGVDSSAHQRCFNTRHKRARNPSRHRMNGRCRESNQGVRTALAERRSFRDRRGSKT